MNGPSLLSISTRKKSNTHQKLPRPPKPLHNPELIETQHPKQHLSAIRKHPSPRHKAPQLSIAPDMRRNGDWKVVARVGDGSGERADDGAEDERLRDGRVGEA